MKVKKLLTSTIAKIIALYIVAFAVVVTIYFIEQNSIFDKTTVEATAQIQNTQDTILDQMKLIDELYTNQVQASMNTLIRTGKSYGTPNYSTTVSFEGKMVPNLRLGTQPVVNNFDLVDALTDDVGGTATLFVKSAEGEFVRVSTNVKKSDGSRAIGTILTPGGAVEQAILNGRAFYGVIDILGKPYFTGYEPMLDSSGKVIGIWYVGYPLEHMGAINNTISGKKVFDNDFFFILDAKERIIARSNSLSDDAIFANLEKAQNKDGWEMSTAHFDQWNYSIIACYMPEEINAIARSESLKLLVNLGIIVVLFSLFIIYFVLSTNKTNKRIMNSAVELSNSTYSVSSAAQQLTASSEKLAEGSSEQASSIQQTLMIMEQSNKMVQENVESTTQAARLSEQMTQSASDGFQQMQEMNDSMVQIRESSNDIAKIIKVIDGIAFQTNLLALNAAVEAARAGDAGAGFAVVAEEVRNLARSSAESAKSTAEIIERNMSYSKKGMDISEKVRTSLEEINNNAEKVSQLVEQISSSSEEQARGSEQVTSAISEIEIVTKQNSAVAEESSSASQALQSQAHKLTVVMEELNKIIGSTEAGNEMLDDSDVPLLE